MDKRLMTLLRNRGGQIKDGCMIDTYNQQIQYDVSCTIRTNINTANHHFIIEECDSKENILTPTKVSTGTQRKSSSEDNLGGGISRTVKTDDSLAVMEENIVEPFNTDIDGCSRTIKAQYYKNGRAKFARQDGLGATGVVQISNLVQEPRIIQAGYVKEGKHQQDFVQHEDGICRTICTGTHASSPHLLKTLVSEPKIIQKFGDKGTNQYSVRDMQIGNIYPDTDGFEDWQTVVGNKQLNPFRGSVEDTSPCITSACGAGGGMTPMLTDAPLEITKTKDFIEQVRGHEPMRYRIRKLTPRECFRLMGCDEETIDTIQAAGISNSQQYKLAGNSIVVDVLYHLFRKMFVETENESQQLTLF